MRVVNSTSLVLIGIIRRTKDFNIALKKYWYRIPFSKAPKRRPVYLAIYETRALGKSGRAINYYASIRSIFKVKRLDLLPEEKDHPRREGIYYKFNLSPLLKLPRPIQNRTRRRLTFGYTSFKKLLTAKEVSGLFDIIPLEEIMKRHLTHNRLRCFHEYCLMDRSHLKYRLDFAIFCRKGKLAIECDNIKWHGQPKRQKEDRKRDRWLKLHGWEVFRFSESEIMERASYCLNAIRKAIHRLGGIC